MTIFDSVKKERLPFEPQEPGKASIYLCGPTVYDDAHLGHARSAIAFDLLYRTLLALEYEVEFCRNYTDIDDKIIKKAKESNQPLELLTSHYIERFEEEMAALHILKPTLTPYATKSLDDIAGMIAKLIKKGHAYSTPEGDLYFDTQSDADYGTLSKRPYDETMAQNRVSHSSHKRHERDFALWKRDEEFGFESPFGKGRPGWHIECSAMIQSHFGSEKSYSIDIHCGGSDLLFPHHENEAAQSRCANGNHLAKYWMHNGFVQIDGQKMSKSLGNSFFLKDALQSHLPELVRFYLMGVHYRSSFNYSDEDMQVAKKRLDKLYRLKKRIYGTTPSKEQSPAKALLLKPMQDDLNISVALSQLDELIASYNEQLDAEPKNKHLKKEIAKLFEVTQSLLGIGFEDAYGYFQYGIDSQTKATIEELIAKRLEAKKAKDFAKADAIRQELDEMGISLMDSAQGTLWEANTTQKDN